MGDLRNVTCALATFETSMKSFDGGSKAALDTVLPVVLSLLALYAMFKYMEPFDLIDIFKELLSFTVFTQAVVFWMTPVQVECNPDYINHLGLPSRYLGDLPTSVKAVLCDSHNCEDKVAPREMTNVTIIFVVLTTFLCRAFSLGQPYRFRVIVLVSLSISLTLNSISWIWWVTVTNDRNCCWLEQLRVPAETLASLMSILSTASIWLLVDTIRHPEPRKPKEDSESVTRNHAGSMSPVSMSHLSVHDARKQDNTSSIPTGQSTGSVNVHL